MEKEYFRNFRMLQNKRKTIQIIRENKLWFYQLIYNSIAYMYLTQTDISYIVSYLSTIFIIVN